MEAAGGFEPPDGGFADPCLTTWLRRPVTIDVQAHSRRGPVEASGPDAVERETGLEPATSTLARLRSTN